MIKQFMVTVLPLQDHREILSVEGSFFSNLYDAALDEFNRQLAERDFEPIKSRSEKPLRAELEDCLIELWIINRSESIYHPQIIDDAS